jgi:hypothetical protein
MLHHVDDGGVAWKETTNFISECELLFHQAVSPCARVVRRALCVPCAPCVHLVSALRGTCAAMRVHKLYARCACARLMCTLHVHREALVRYACVDVACVARHLRTSLRERDVQKTNSHYEITCPYSTGNNSRVILVLVRLCCALHSYSLAPAVIYID